MYIAFVVGPAFGHVPPLSPLAWALKARGHRVVMVSGASGGGAGGRVGLPVVDAIPGKSYMDMIMEAGAAEPDLFAPMDDLTEEELMDRMPLVLASWAPQVPAYLECLTELRPDAIVFDTQFLAGYVAAQKLSIPMLGYNIAFSNFDQELYWSEAVQRAVEPMGVSGAPFSQVLPAPEDIVPTAQADPIRLNAYGFGGGGTPPISSRRGHVAACFGTSGEGVDWRTGVDWSAELARHTNSELVVTSTKFDEQAPGTHFQWAPWDEIARGASVAVHHGGPGTALACMVHGVPQVSLGQGADCTYNGLFLERIGLAVAATADALPDVPEAATRVKSPAVRNRVTEVADAFDRLPSLAEGAMQVEARLQGETRSV